MLYYFRYIFAHDIFSLSSPVMTRYQEAATIISQDVQNHEYSERYSEQHNRGGWPHHAREHLRIRTSAEAAIIRRLPIASIIPQLTTNFTSLVRLT